ncbi:carbohydrate kinase [Streptomyces durbertensis]|uniref:Carbohydrate kinase n=1 Tax=Streptomyces durbertensis TaxID=2448886 RepID=A0ABR6ECR8_9ACTN|nr:carbohydrate kinase [Streptomyces durbertensis]MBB1242790.1 carbohydrate kinase [Streptomyces durbertensis]
MLVIGECVADIVQGADGREHVHPGGSPANVAYGLARLGHPTDLLTQLGEDRLGALLSAHLRSAGVRVRTDGAEGVRTPSATVRLGGGQHGDGARYEFDINWTLRPTPLPATDHLHIGSIGAVLEPGATTVLAAAEELRQGATVSYDPNVRPALMGRRADAVAHVERCVSLSDIVKASDEDLAWLLPDEPPEEVAGRWAALGPSLVLVTRGARGSFAVPARGDVLVDRHPHPVVVADTVGAGDAFMAGALHALAAAGLLGADRRAALAALGERQLGDVLRVASAAAAVTVTRPGANPPDEAELAAALAEG